ncbi:hypothetical protein B5P41_31990, partial [Bacillus sp. SRB_28]
VHPAWNTSVIPEQRFGQWNQPFSKRQELVSYDHSLNGISQIRLQPCPSEQVIVAKVADGLENIGRSFDAVLDSITHQRSQGVVAHHLSQKQRQQLLAIALTSEAAPIRNRLMAAPLR